MRQPDGSAEACLQFAKACLGGGQVQRLAVLDQRAHPVHPRALRQLAGHRVGDVGQRVQAVQGGADRLAPGRLAGEPADLHLAPLGQQQGARDGRGRHHQHVGGIALGAEG